MNKPNQKHDIDIDPSNIKIQEISCRDYTLPENRAHIDELKESIRKNGILFPLTIRLEKKQAILVDGEARFRAWLELRDEGVNIPYFPCQEQNSDE